MVQKAKKGLRWWGWLLLLIWLALLIFFLQYALASASEYEPRAELISWISFIFCFIIGIILLIRKKRA